MHVPPLRTLILRGSMSLFFVSLVLPALTVRGATMSGWYVLLIGWLGYATSEYRWYANPLFLLALITVRCSIKGPNLLAITLATAGVCVSASCLVVVPRVPAGALTSPPPDPAVLEVGAYCWLLAHVLLLFAAAAPYAVTQTDPSGEIQDNP
jgi:hypothetical protein